MGAMGDTTERSGTTSNVPEHGINSDADHRRGHANPLEKRLIGMDDDGLEAWMQDKLKGYVAPKLKLKPKSEHTAPYQVPRRNRYQTPQKLRSAVMAGIKKKLKARSLKLVAYSHAQWISMMFVKAKGRKDPETGEEALRFLTDLRAVNAGLDWSGFWNEWMPTLTDMKRGVPRWAKWFAVEDVADVFEHVLMARGDENMLTVAPPVRLTPDMFTDAEMTEWGYTSQEIAALRKEGELLLQWQHCPQGLAPIAPFWNVYFGHGMNAVFGEEWQDWMICYVDDVMVYGLTENQCKQRQRLLSMALRLLDKKVSSKLDRTVKQEGHLVGNGHEIH
jgi:hypothetical protein